MSSPTPGAAVYVLPQPSHPLAVHPRYAGLDEGALRAELRMDLLLVAAEALPFISDVVATAMEPEETCAVSAGAVVAMPGRRRLPRVRWS